MIEYREFGSRLIEDIYRIYEENGWSAYLSDKDKLIRSFDKSLYILGAFDEEKLVGFIRCVGDDEYIVYIQDLIIRPEYQRKGIGKKLMELTSKRFSSVRQFVLITDKNDEVSNAFYQAIGLTEEFNGYPITHYFRR